MTVTCKLYDQRIIDRRVIANEFNKYFVVKQLFSKTIISKTIIYFLSNQYINLFY